MFKDLNSSQPQFFPQTGGETETLQRPKAAQPLLPGLVLPEPDLADDSSLEESELHWTDSTPSPGDAPSFLQRPGASDQGDPAVPSPGTDASGLAGWKAALRSDFEEWLSSLDQIPDPEGDRATELPDLYSFYEQLALANVESRKANRRTVEAFSQWADTLARFESQLAPLRESTAQLTAVQAKDNELPRAHCLILVELLDRMHRLAKAFEFTPAKKSWWTGADAAWRGAWATQRQGLDILLSHFDQLLQKEGVSRIEVLDQPFDPSVMTAVAADPDSDRPAQTVLEEIAPGYRRRAELLRPAQVKVSVRR